MDWMQYELVTVGGEPVINGRPLKVLERTMDAWLKNASVYRWDILIQSPNLILAIAKVGRQVLVFVR